MKLKAALVAALVGVSLAAANAAVVDQTEPPATPAGGAPETGIGATGAAGIAITIAVIAAVAGGGGDGGGGATATATATGTN